MTQADIAVTDHVRALHRGKDRPRVHRLIERPTRLAPPTAFSPQEMPEALTDPTRAS
jgi:hypothetical protein